jgi:hypothetical protein
LPVYLGYGSITLRGEENSILEVDSEEEDEEEEWVEAEDR